MKPDLHCPIDRLSYIGPGQTWPSWKVAGHAAFERSEGCLGAAPHVRTQEPRGLVRWAEVDSGQL